jgi:Cu/Ag efflux pump CusA
MQRRLLTVPGVVQVVAWGGTTKIYDVEVDLHKLDAYNITLPQVLTAIGNANINVGGRTINVGLQSVDVRGVGLIEKVGDIENIVLSSQRAGSRPGERRGEGLRWLFAEARQRPVMTMTWLPGS